MTVKYYSVYNACIAGTLAGSQAGRKTLNNPTTGDQVEPADFATQLAAAQIFATEVDAILQSTIGPPANLAALVNDGATVVPASASVANAAQSLPPAMAAQASALWSGTTFPPINSTTGNPWAAADYQPFANSLAAQFLEYCTGTANS
jgi:hypothetical protein